MSIDFSYRNQQTIGKAVQVSGFGYWSGLDVTVEFRPAEIDNGIRFIRADLVSQPAIEARIFNRVDALRRTALAKEQASVELVEHILAALAGLRIDNCDVWVNRAEMPGCDGSSQPFVQQLDAAGIVQQNAVNPLLIIREPIKISYKDAWILAEPNDKQALTVSYDLHYENPQIGSQSIELDVTPESFRNELAPARTFLLEAEANWLRAQGLGLRVSYDDVLVFSDNGPIENELRFENECVRHKAMDVVGDLAICGCDIIGRIRAHRSGHALNGKLVYEMITKCEIVVPERRAA